MILEMQSRTRGRVTYKNDNLGSLIFRVISPSLFEFDFFSAL